MTALKLGSGTLPNRCKSKVGPGRGLPQAPPRPGWARKRPQIDDFAGRGTWVCPSCTRDPAMFPRPGISWTGYTHVLSVREPQVCAGPGSEAHWKLNVAWCRQLHVPIFAPMQSQIGPNNLPEWPQNWSTGLKICANRAGRRPGPFPDPPGGRKRPKIDDFRSYPPPNKKTKT